jgi:hypothetical protein
MMARAAWAAIGLALFGFVVLFCGNELQHTRSLSNLGDRSPISLSNKSKSLGVPREIETKFRPPLLFKAVLVGNLPKNIETPTPFLSFENLDPFSLQEFSFPRDDVPARSRRDLWEEGEAALSTRYRQFWDDKAFRQRMRQNIHHASMFSSVSWSESIIRLGKAKYRGMVGMNIFEGCGIDRNIGAQLPDSSILHGVQGFTGRFRLEFSGVRRFLSRLCGELGVIQAFANEPELPQKQANLKAANSDQQERKEARSIFREPWLRSVGAISGLLTGLGVGWVICWPKRAKRRQSNYRPSD